MLKAFLFFILFIGFTRAQACLVKPFVYKKVSPDAYYGEVYLKSDWKTSPVMTMTSLEQFKEKIKKVTDVNPFYLLKKQGDIFKQTFPNLYPQIKLALDGKVGSFYSAGCVESAIWGAHLKSFQPETEFLAYILKTEILGFQFFKAHVITYNMSSIPTSDLIDSMLEKDLKLGWQILVNLHSHPFLLNNSSGDIGGTIKPSGPDIDLYLKQKQKWNLPEAWVTNGFHTFRLPAAEFELLKE